MTLSFLDTAVPGVVLIGPDVFVDSRGFFLETWHQERYSTGGVHVRFVQDNHSRSRRGVIRGLHYQLVHSQAKLVYVVRGAILDVAVDIRRGSSTFGRWTGHILSGENRKQLFIPQGFAHGFSVLSDVADVTYKCSDYYVPGDDYGIVWNDPVLSIDWQNPAPTVSEKDRNNPGLQDIPLDRLPVFK